MFKKISELYYSSLTFHVYRIIREKVFEHPIYKFFTDFSFVSDLWHKSFAFSVISKKLEIVIAKKAYLPNEISFSAVFLCLLFIMLSLPQSILPPNIYFATALTMLIFLMNTASRRQIRVDCFLFTFFSLLFTMTAYIFLPGSAFQPLLSLLTALAIYFVIVSSESNQKQLKLLLFGNFFMIIIRCAEGIIYKNITGVSHAQRASFFETLILLTPPALSFASLQKSTFKQHLYSAVILLLTIFSVLYSKSTAAYIGFFMALILFAAVSAPKHLILVLLSAPAVFVYIIERFINIWTVSPQSEDYVNNIVYMALNFWNNGLWIGSKPFLQSYINAASSDYNAFTLVSQLSDMQIDIYAGTFFRIGYVTLFIILWYNLKLIRSALCGIFTAPVKKRVIFAAGLSSLIGISVCNVLKPSALGIDTLIAYSLVVALLSLQSKNA